MALEALIFDVDGTLAETERDGHRVAFNRAFSEVGLPWSWDAELYNAMLPIAGGKERMHHYADTFQPRTAREPNFSALVARAHALKTEFYLELVAAGRLPLRPGVSALINEARERGLRLAIATTTTPANVTALLELHAGRRCDGLVRGRGRRGHRASQETRARHLPVGARAPGPRPLAGDRRSRTRPSGWRPRRRHSSPRSSPQATTRTATVLTARPP